MSGVVSCAVFASVQGPPVQCTEQAGKGGEQCEGNEQISSTEGTYRPGFQDQDLLGAVPSEADREVPLGRDG